MRAAMETVEVLCVRGAMSGARRRARGDGEEESDEAVG